MANYAEQSEVLKQTLGLEWTPVAVRVSNSADERGDSSRKLLVCQAFDAARREKATINFSLENCICPGGKHYAGLEILPLETVATTWTKRHSAYESMETALASLKRQPQPQKRGNVVTISPLEKAANDPDLVILFVNSEQADRVLSLVSYGGAEPFAYYPVSNVCSVITNTLAKGRPEINFLCSHARRLVKWSPNELMIALPLQDFQAMIRNIPFSGYGKPALETPKH